MTYYHVSLKWAALILGLLMVAGSALVLMAPARFLPLKTWLPRNVPLGIAAGAVACAWFCGLVNATDLTDFTPYRFKLILGALILFGLACVFLSDFLLPRALGILLMLGADLLLSAAFPVETPARYLVTVLAYVWVIAGMTLVAVPYRFRDALEWGLAHAARVRWLAGVKLAVGALLVLFSIVFYP